MLVPFICVIPGSNGNGVNLGQEAGKGPFIYYVSTCRERGLENVIFAYFQYQKNAYAEGGGGVPKKMKMCLRNI